MKKILIIPDTHVPAHHAESWAEMIRFGRRWKPDILVHLGDFLDMYYASTHEHLAPAPALEEEFRIGRKLRKEMDSLGARRKVMRQGNHEYRLERIIRTKLPEIAGIVPTVADQLELKKYGWEYYPYNSEPTRIGKVCYTHKLGTNSNAMIALRGGTNFVSGHTHRLEQLYSGTYTGEQHVSVMAGWLGDATKVHFDYACPITKAHTWTRGFVTGEMDSDGNTKLHLHPIL